MSGFGPSAEVTHELNDDDLDAAVELLLQRANLLTQQHLKELDLILSQYLKSRNEKPLTLFEQMMQQRKILQQLTDKLFSVSGGAKENVGAKDVKDGISAMGQLTKMLADLEAQVYTAERSRRIESVLIQTIKTLPQPDQDTFFQMLEANFISSNTLDYSAEIANEI